MSRFSIFAGITPDGRLDIGANAPVRPAGPAADRVESLAAGRSGAITFVTTTAEAPDTADTATALAETAAMREILGRMDRLIAEAVPVDLTVSAIDDDRMVTLVPGPEWMRHPALRYSVRQNILAAMTGKRIIRTGDTFAARITGCRLPDVYFECSGEGDGSGDTSDVETELMAQPYATFLQCTPTGRNSYTDKDGTERTTVVIDAYGQHALGTVAENVLNTPLPDGTAVLRIARGKHGHPVLDDNFLSVKALPYAPPAGEHPSTAIGTVHSFFGADSNSLMQVIFNARTDRAWRSGVFSRLKDGTWMLPFPVMDAARLYIRTGYPCRFPVEINPRDPGKSKLLLAGLSARLEGRAPHTVDTRRLKDGTPVLREPMAPAATCGGFIYMVSADCTALLPVAEAPLPLRLMSELGIYSPHFTIGCQTTIVRLPGENLRFRVAAVPMNVDVYKARPAGSAVADVRICCSAGERLILMADGCPAMSPELPYETRIGLLRGGIKARWTVAQPCDGDRSWLNLDFAAVDARDTGLRLGSVFELGRDSSYRRRPVIAVPEGEPRAEGTIMMMIGTDSATGAIVATDELARYTDAPGSGIDRMRLHTGLLRYGTVVAECADGRLTAYSTRSPLERTIFRRLARIYGDDATALMRRDDSYMRIGCIWTGVACQHDYTDILGDIAPDVAALWDGLADDTPVLFGDVPLTRADLPGLSAESADSSAAAGQTAGEEIAGTVLASVASVDEQTDTVTFYLGGTRFVRDVPREALRLPLPRTQRKKLETRPLDEIFLPGEQWRLDMSLPDEPRLYAHTDAVPRPHTLVARLNNTEWVLRTDDGAIAVTDSIEEGRSGQRILAVHSSLDGSVPYAELSDDNFVGRKMRLRVVEVTDTAVLCSDMSGHILRRIELPLDRVSWNPAWSPTMLGPGTVLKACVTEVETDRVVVDRRMLLRQEALYEGVAPEPGTVYQMEVAGVEESGYRLTQNGVDMLLPFDKAAIFDITVFNDSVLRPGDLVAVRTGADGATADWLSTRLDEIAELDRDPDESYAFTVRHHCPDGIFLERRGIMAFLPNRQLGHWAGIPLEAEFPAGTIIDLLIVRSPETGTLEASLRNPQRLRPAAPAVGHTRTARVAYTYPGNGFYAITPDSLPVYVETADIPDAGTEVYLSISAVNESTGLLLGKLL